MKTSTMKRSIAVLGTLVLLGLASTALAERKAGPGMMDGYGYTTLKDYGACPPSEKGMIVGEDKTVKKDEGFSIANVERQPGVKDGALAPIPRGSGMVASNEGASCLIR
jgi:hypothetical protein